VRRWLAAALLAAAPALAQEEPRFCPNRPDLGASACTTRPGQVLVEGSLVDWTRSEDAASREDQVLAADLLVRVGLAESAELQLGWTPYGRVRERDKTTGRVTTREGTGDVRIAVRRHLLGANGDGDGLAVALEPFVTLPVGRAPVGDSDWSAGVVLPVSYALSDRWDLAFTGEAAATPDEDGRRRFAWGATLGLGRAITEQVGAVAELSVNREGGPATARTEVVTALSLAWQPRPGLQLDVLGVAGLNRVAPDFRLQLGGAILFR
jgi:hypothetical protein